MARGKAQKRSGDKVLKAEDVIKSSNAKDSLIHTNLDRFKFKVGDMSNPNTLNYRSKINRSCWRDYQGIPERKMDWKRVHFFC